MIRLTRYRDKKPVYVFPEAIISAEIVDDATMINARSDRIFVTESPEEVARKVLEWRLLISKYDSLRNAIAQEWGKGSQEQLICEVELVKISLYKLAGLEEPT